MPEFMKEFGLRRTRRDPIKKSPCSQGTPVTEYLMFGTKESW